MTKRKNELQFTNDYLAYSQPFNHFSIYSIKITKLLLTFAFFFIKVLDFWREILKF